MEFQRINSDYNKLINIKFKFYLSNNDEVELVFKKENVPHLIGLQYMTDIDPLFREFNNKKNKSITANNILDKVIEKDIRYQCIKSQLDENLIFRIEEFTYNNIIKLIKKSSTFRIVRNEKKITEKSKYVFIEKFSDRYIHLYLGLDSSKKHYYPLSFCSENEKESSIQKKPLYISKTIVIEQGNITETIEHDEIKKICSYLSEEIKKFNKKNSEFYNNHKKNINQENSVILLCDINTHIKNIVYNYNELQKKTKNLDIYFNDNPNKAIQSFFDYYPKYKI